MDSSVLTNQYMAMVRQGRACTTNDNGLPEMRLAILADHASQQMTLVLKAALVELGFFPAVYEAEYATAAFEAFDPGSGLYAFKPEAVLLTMAVQKYRDRFLGLKSTAEREALPRAYLSDMLTIVDTLSQAGMRVIVNNLALPVERMFGSFAALTNQSLYGSVLQFNMLLSEAVLQRKGCALNDVMYIANRVGTENFFDERMWLNAKYLCSSQMLPEVTRSIARALVVRRGKVSKCIVLDLDNTLWGGVIGDDGLDGIVLGGNAVGEAFRLFQSYLLALRDRGYVLAVCSKNTESVAIEAFRRHPEMIITENDIAVFVANWNDKASNIEYIARVLNLGLDSFIFIDDSPFERDLVRTALPQVLVPDMPEDPADYVKAIEESGLLESSGFSQEDSTRNQNYRIEAQRATEQIKYGSIDDYLASLGMQADCRTFRKEDLPRVAQLLQRSNQFNLRTQRFSEADCERYMLETDRRIGLQIKLADKFGDYGLISVVCCDVEDGALVVSELVMSCRVLKRGVEDYIMNRLFEECRARGLDGVRGEYRPTAKNGMVRSFFEGFGFLAQEHDAVREQWYLPADRYELRPTFIGTTRDE